ncbi:hypothetical protein CMI37_19420 [Candidatus Pacearchaeota archaeon]|nr:hypothetical protein [Candidatus Pacearchaeota archaeon]|tara:strand:+ start:593 stop:871 length:279 start_codon:yes stop_codon:yes gene_type:complete
MANEMDGFDLRKFQEDGEEKEKVKNIVGKIVSGRAGYRVVEDKKAKKIERCAECNWVLKGGEKFCPECGAHCREKLECDSANKNCEVVEECD